MSSISTISPSMPLTSEPLPLSTDDGFLLKVAPTLTTGVPWYYWIIAVAMLVLLFALVLIISYVCREHLTALQCHGWCTVAYSLLK